MVYGQFSKTYQKLMNDELYPLWVSYVEKYVTKKQSILELACGSGEVANLLSQKGYTIVGSDLSENMLSLAYQTNPKICWLQLNMADFQLDETYDSIICFADSLCYLQTEIEMQKTFQNVYNTLNNNGIFLFDVHSLYQINEVFHEYTYHYVDEDTVFIWESFPGDYANSVEHELTCVQETQSGIYERYDELHKQRTYSLEQYISWLKSVGFSNIEMTSDFGENTITDNTTRWFFKCEKHV